MIILKQMMGQEITHDDTQQFNSSPSVIDPSLDKIKRPQTTDQTPRRPENKRFMARINEAFGNDKEMLSKIHNKQMSISSLNNVRPKRAILSAKVNTLVEPPVPENMYHTSNLINNSSTHHRNSR